MMHRFFPILIILLLVGCQTAPTTPPPPTATPIPVQGEIMIDTSTTQQTIEGFGASGAWWAQHVGGWEDEVRQRVITLLFDPAAGIGLSIYRYNIGGGDNPRILDDWRRAETFEVAAGKYDWSRDANAIWVLKAAQEAGVEKFVAFANSPPAHMTFSGRTNGDRDNLSNLRPEMYAAFAQYLVDVVRHLQVDEGVPIGWLSPINEPQWEWQLPSGQEGSHYEPQEVAAMTKALIAAVKANELDVKLSVFEGGEWAKSSTQYVAPLLDDPEIAPYVDHLAVHSYWSSPDDKARFVRYLDQNYPDVAIEMTEWTEMREGRDTSMDSALLLANTIHDDLTIGRSVSWQYWIAVSKYKWHDGLLYVDVANHALTETKRLWAMGNYSRFVRPGFQRVAAESSLEPRLKTAVFQSPTSQQLVVVAINNARDPYTVQLDGVPSYFTHLTSYETTETHDLAEVFAGSSPSLMTFAAKSVTTLVYEK